MRISARAVVALLLVAACSDSTKPVDPATVVRVAISPANIAILKGAKGSLSLSTLDASGADVHADARWFSSDSSIATVSQDGTVTGVNYGAVDIIALVNGPAAPAHVLVMASPAPRTYALADLGAAATVSGEIARQLSDSGDVVSGPGATLYRNGIGIALSGCAAWVAINGPGHVLCRTATSDAVSSYAIWHDGTLTPLAAADTFAATDFRAFALNDSDEVAGLFYMPTFSNAQCPATGVRCLAIWKGGMVSFPGYNALNDVMLFNLRHQVVLESPIWYEDGGRQALVRDVPSGSQRIAPWGVHALNENGWGAVETPYRFHDTNTSGTSASVTTPDHTIYLGDGGATGINDANVVVGTLAVGPFIWRGQGGVSLLDHAAIDPSWTITRASEINNRGQILATADNTDGRKGHAVILTPTQP